MADRRPTRNNVNRSEGTEVDFRHVGLMHQPRVEIRAKTLTRLMVDFQQPRVFEPCAFQPLGEPAATGKKL